MASWNEYGCANCGAELDPGSAPERREVPRRGGRVLPVCDECATALDEHKQLKLGEEAVERAQSAGGIAILDLGQLYPADRCVWCAIPARKEKLRNTVVKSAMARAVECENRKRCMQRQRARREAA